jgi:hypothetical protein
VPFVERIIEITFFGLEKYSKDGQTFIFSLMNNMELKIKFLSVYVVLGFMMQMELNCSENFGSFILCDVDGGEGEGSLKVFVAGIVGNLSIFCILGG